MTHANWIQRLRLMTLTAVCAVVASLLVAAGFGQEAGKKEVRYIGAAKCKNCHRSEESGNQFGAWLEARHSKAFETLGSERAKSIAAERSISDPQKDEACIRCHRTGHGLPESRFKRGFDPEAGVQCETCHGPGDDHMKARMKAAATGDTESVEHGEMIAAPSEAQCRACHNPESPTYQHFCFACRTSKIRHLNPKRRSAEEVAALAAAATEACDCEADCGAEVCKH